MSQHSTGPATRVLDRRCFPRRALSRSLGLLRQQVPARPACLGAPHGSAAATVMDLWRQAPAKTAPTDGLCDRHLNPHLTGTFAADSFNQYQSVIGSSQRSVRLPDPQSYGEVERMSVDPGQVCVHADVNLLSSEPSTGIPYGRLAEVRASACPVVDSSFHDLNVVTRFEDVRFVLESPDIFSSKDPAITGPSPVQLPPLSSDAPIHAGLRKLLNPLFSRNHFKQYEQNVRDIAAGAIEKFLARGSCDFVSEFTVPFVSGVLAKLVFNESDPDRLAEAVRTVATVAEEQTQASFEQLGALAAGYLIEKKENLSPDDQTLLGVVAAGSVDGRPLDMEEQIGVIAVLFLGGLDTTRGAIGNIASHVATKPGLEDRIRDPEWVKQDLEEFIRFESPVINMARTVTTEVELGGRTLVPGDRVGVSFSSANRDAERFDDPDTLEFEVRRPGHAGFGMGVHRCLGMHLARFQIAIAFEELFARITNIRLQDGFAPEKTPGVALGPASLLIDFDRV